MDVLKSNIQEAVKNGAKVYAVAAKGSYDDEMKAFGITVDPKIEEYYQNCGVENFKI
ncbi:MAG: hypothetical protein ACPLSJ_02760 [Thermosulfidibacteraceae bacterium]